MTKARLAEAAKGFAPHAEPLPIPASPSYSAAKVRRPAFRPRLLQRSKLAALARGAEGSLLVTPSRRTRADSLAALSAAIKDVPHIVWDDDGDNPYFAFLALADPSSRLRIR